MAFTPTLFQSGTKWLFKAGISNQGPNTVLAPQRTHLAETNECHTQILRRAAGHYYINYLQIDQAILWLKSLGFI